jgi:hypothetical protein
LADPALAIDGFAQRKALAFLTRHSRLLRHYRLVGPRLRH